MAYVINLEVSEGKTVCPLCPFFSEGTSPDYDSCGLPIEFPKCEEVNYSTMKMVKNDN